MKLTLVRTPAGNFGRLARGLERAGARVEIRPPRALDGSEGAVVLAGVSSFESIADALAPARRALLDHVARGTPLLGVCAGFQVMHKTSEEGPGTGLELLPGRVRRLKAPRLPNLGWSRLQIGEGRGEILEGVPDGSYAYFAHSYRAPSAPGIVASRTRYGPEAYPSSVQAGNLWGVQFHPELSGTTGARVLSNFVARCEEESS